MEDIRLTDKYLYVRDWMNWKKCLNFTCKPFSFSFSLFLSVYLFISFLHQSIFWFWNLNSHVLSLFSSFSFKNPNPHMLYLPPSSDIQRQWLIKNKETEQDCLDTFERNNWWAIYERIFGHLKFITDLQNNKLWFLNGWFWGSILYGKCNYQSML